MTPEVASPEIARALASGWTLGLLEALSRLHVAQAQGTPSYADAVAVVRGLLAHPPAFPVASDD